MMVPASQTCAGLQAAPPEASWNVAPDTHDRHTRSLVEEGMVTCSWPAIQLVRVEHVRSDVRVAETDSNCDGRQLNVRRQATALDNGWYDAPRMHD